MVTDAREAQARLRALAACERRMGLAKTSWEEQERKAALAYLQADRDKTRQAALAAERRHQRSMARGKPSSAPVRDAHVLSHHGEGPRTLLRGDGDSLLTLHECALVADASLDDGIADCHVDGDALSRIADIAAAVRLGLADDRFLLGEGRAESADEEHSREGGREAEANAASHEQDLEANSRAEMECDISDIPDGVSVGSRGQGSSADAPDGESSLLGSVMCDVDGHGREDETGEEAEAEEELTTPERLGRIRSVALGILVGGVAPTSVRVPEAVSSARRGSGPGPGAELRAGGGEDAGDAEIAGEAMYAADEEETRLWLEQAQVGVPALVASVVEVRGYGVRGD